MIAPTVAKRPNLEEGLKEGRAFDAEMVKYLMQVMVEESGARQLLYTTVEDALCDGGAVTGAIIVNKAGRSAVTSKVLVDCTGDGDVAARSGAAFEKGREDGHLQASTLWLEIGGVDEEAFYSGFEEYLSKAPEYLKTERATGHLHLPPECGPPSLVWKGSTLEPGHFSVNFDTILEIDATNPWELTRGTNESRHGIFEMVDFFRKHLPGGKDCFVAKTGTSFGARETRRLRGTATITGQEVVDGRKRPDGICRASFAVDLHDYPDRWPRSPLLGRGPKEGDWYEIPYGCLVPETVDGLLLAGRCISSDRHANGSLRVMVTCMATGQAAGTAAALCVKDAIKPRALDVNRLRRILKERFGVDTARSSVIGSE
jgi:hypothetical protein